MPVSSCLPGLLFARWVMPLVSSVEWKSLFLWSSFSWKKQYTGNQQGLEKTCSQIPDVTYKCTNKGKEWFIAACSFAVNVVKDPEPKSQQNPDGVVNRNMPPMLRCDPELPTFQRTIPLLRHFSYNVNLKWCHCSGLDKYFPRNLILYSLWYWFLAVK